MVFGFMLTSDRPIVPHHTMPVPEWHFEAQDIRRAAGTLFDPLPAVLRVSKQFAQEASVVFWSTNTFRLDLNHHRTWLNRIGRQSSFLIRRLGLECCQDFADDNVATWITKLVGMGNTIKKRCLDLREMELRFGFLQTVSDDILDGRQCLRLFVENEALRTAWNLTRLKRLSKVTIRVQEEWEHTEDLVRLLNQFTATMRSGVVVEGFHVAWVDIYPLPGGEENTHHLHPAHQERKFYEGWVDRETEAVVTRRIPWETPVGWPTIYRQGHNEQEPVG